MKNSKQMPGEFHTPSVRTPTKTDSKQMPEELLQMPKQMLEHSPTSDGTSAHCRG
uniref:Uncharacterized protein n=1 Tax=Meloidogyne enterolobii TaxID=390850 RepID=A0A6V7UVS0_MELEN|nr:unnamed protein product [Meloidogyne enterolobii]